MDKCCYIGWAMLAGAMGETRLPTIMLFGEMKKKIPAHEPIVGGQGGMLFLMT